MLGRSSTWKTNPSQMENMQKKIMKADSTVLKNHVASKTHKLGLKSIDDTKPIKSYFPGIEKRDTSTQEAEIKICAFMTAHNIPFAVIDHLIPLMKNCFPDSKIAQNLKMKNKKCTSIIKNVLAKSQKEKLAEKLKLTKFSVLTDESTDVSSAKTVCKVLLW